MRHVMEAALGLIERDRSLIPIKPYPFTRKQINNAPALIVIDPAVSGDRPIIAGLIIRLCVS